MYRRHCRKRSLKRYRDRCPDRRRLRERDRDREDLQEARQRLSETSRQA